MFHHIHHHHYFEINYLILSYGLEGISLLHHSKRSFHYQTKIPNIKRLRSEVKKSALHFVSILNTLTKLRCLSIICVKK